MPDDGIQIGAFRKNEREEVRVKLTNFKGTDLFDIRVWYKTADLKYLAIVGESEELSGEDVLPGFGCPLSRVL